MNQLISAILFFFAFISTGNAQYNLSNADLNAQDISVKTIYHSLGKSIVPIRITQYGQKDNIVCISLHNDEFTSVAAAKYILEKNGGLLIELVNNGKRNLKFNMGFSIYIVDPNRIFSLEGISVSLKNNGKFSIYAAREVEKLGKRLIQLLPENLVGVIALHNNTNDGFSVIEYLPGEKRDADAARVNVDPDQDPDDFFFTTNPYLFQELTSKKYNTVLQDNENCQQDGSLSVYCGKNKIRYVNLETEHGKYGQYAEMIVHLYEIFNTLDISSEQYNFIAALSSDIKLPGAGSPIYFGNKKIGKINSIQPLENNVTISGTILIKNDFPLHSNMSFYLLSDEYGNPRYEIRIDPTIGKKQLNSREDKIELKIKLIRN